MPPQETGVRSRWADMGELYRKFAAAVSDVLSSGLAFLIAVAAMLFTGWYFRFSEQWSSALDFVITVGTFLILFFLQKSQKVGDKVTHAKIDELIRAVEGARNTVAAIEDKTEKEIDEVKKSVLEECDDQETVAKDKDTSSQ